MNMPERINSHIFRLTTPYKDIYTTVCAVKTPAGSLLFDSASYPDDIDAAVLPFLRETGADKDLRYVFISHNHTDHAGGLARLLDHFQQLTVVSSSASLRVKFPQTAFVPAQGVLLDTLQVVPLPGHTADSAALLDLRTGLLLSGDCLQMYGIFGSGKWGANLPFPAAHLRALEALRALPVEQILAAHDYHPCGHFICGKEAVAAALDSCAAPIRRVCSLIASDPTLDDEAVCALYHSGEPLPSLGAHVVAAVRKAAAERSLPLSF